MPRPSISISDYNTKVHPIPDEREVAFEKARARGVEAWLHKGTRGSEAILIGGVTQETENVVETTDFDGFWFVFNLSDIDGGRGMLAALPANKGTLVVRQNHHYIFLPTVYLHAPVRYRFQYTLCSAGACKSDGFQRPIFG